MPPTLSADQNSDRLFTVKQLIYARCQKCCCMVNWIHMRAGGFSATCCAWSHIARPTDGSYDVYRIKSRKVKGKNLILFRRTP